MGEPSRIGLAINGYTMPGSGSDSVLLNSLSLSWVFSTFEAGAKAPILFNSRDT